MNPLAPPPLPFPQAQQRRNYPHVLQHPCPICNAADGEPCRPASLSIPHLARCEMADQFGGAA